MQYVLYGIIVLVATTIGAMTGVGGGIVMKPAFDVLNFDSASLINLYSGFAVFSMCVISLVKRMKAGTKFRRNTAFSLAFGSILGGWIGDKIFTLLILQYENAWIRFIQNSVLLLILVLICIYTIKKTQFPHYHLKNSVSIVLIGLIIGMISVFLGIGGGPLNIAVLMIAFSFTAKEAGIYSLIMIFFAQITKLLTTLPIIHTMGVNFPLVLLMIMIAIIGGNLGTRLQFQLSDRQVERGYLGLMIVLIMICIYNVLSI